MKEDYHIDMSGRIYEKRTIGIACVGATTKHHKGCAVKGNLIKLLEKNIFIGTAKEENAKVYAICIYLLVKDDINNINTLIICNDEHFLYVKEYLLLLLGYPNPPFEIINISELKKKLGRNVKSLADNFAKCYRKRALNKLKWNTGKQLNVIDIDYNIINNYWAILNI